MKHEDAIYLQHILDAIVKIEKYLQGYSKDTFLETTLVQDAVIRQIEIIGEAAKQLSREVRTQHANVPGRILPG